jgi:hypothetical protein
MVASIAACHAAYEDREAYLSEWASRRSRTMLYCVDDVKGALVEDPCEAWIDQTRAPLKELVHVMTDMGMNPCDVFFRGNQGHSSFVDYA